MARAFALLLSVSCLAPSAAARAQTATEVAAARELFTQGLTAIEEQRWADARDLFTRSYEIVPRSSTLVNLAHAQTELGQLIEAQQTYRRFLAEPGSAAPLVEDTRAALHALDPRIAHATIVIDGLEAGDVVRLDGESLSGAALETRLPMNPGVRVIEVLRDGQPIGETRFTLAEGQDFGEVGVTLAAGATFNPPVEDPVTEPTEGDDILTSPWLWIGVGAAVLLGVVIAIGVAAGQPADPFVGNLGPGMVTF